MPLTKNDIARNDAPAWLKIYIVRSGEVRKGGKTKGVFAQRTMAESALRNEASLLGCQTRLEVEGHLLYCDDWIFMESTYFACMTEVEVIP